MGHQAIIYGRIQEYWEGTSARWPLAPDYNRAVLESLPDEDGDWPFLTRHLFAAPKRSVCGAAERGFYRGSVIHFGASLKDGPEEPDWPEQFAAKLERLVLTRLLWTSAKIHFESAFFPERVFLYRADGASLAEVYEELGQGRFGERAVSEVRWSRREVFEAELRPDWLY